MADANNRTPRPMRIEVVCPRDDGEYKLPDTDLAEYFVIPARSIEGARSEEYIRGDLHDAHARYVAAVAGFTAELAGEHGTSLRDCGWASDQEAVVEAARELGRYEGMAQVAAEYRGELHGMNHNFWMSSRHKDLSRKIHHHLSVGVMTRMLKRGVSLPEFAAKLEMRPKEAIHRLRWGKFDVNHVGAMCGVLDWDPNQVLGQKPNEAKHPAGPDPLAPAGWHEELQAELISASDNLDSAAQSTYLSDLFKPETLKGFEANAKDIMDIIERMRRGPNA